MVATLAMNVTESLVFREDGKKRPQSEDLPQVAKQSFRELELLVNYEETISSSYGRRSRQSH
jgi:hypothetical protein